MSGDHQPLRDFIRHTLGCGCPDEVLDKIQITSLESPHPIWPPTQRINVGGRLLIYLIEGVSTPLDNAMLSERLRTGVKERESGGFNRFRLVVGCNGGLPDPSHQPLLTSALFPGDEKVHLHLLPQTAIPASRPPA